VPEIERYSESFDDFRDHPDSAFYAAAGLSPEETNREVVRSMDDVLRTIVERHQRGEQIPISAEALRGWHHDIFASTFPADAGRIRWKTDAGLWEIVTFGINIGTQLTRRVLGRQGAKPRAIPRRLDRIFAAYDAEFARAQREGTTLHDAALNATHVYAKTLSVHPFVDGNLRASFIALQAALLNYGLPPVIFKDLDAHDDHLDTALRPGGRKQSYEPFAQHLADLIRDGR
jgi:fido (protein-threonine AMPylation protein)